MSNQKEKQFTKEELEKLQDIQKKYANLQIKFGQLAFAKLRIDDEIKKVDSFEKSIREDFTKVQTDETEFTAEVTKKYGEGTLDPQSGKFSPNLTGK
jgi:hypothetical protein